MCVYIYIYRKLCNRAASRILEVSYRLLCRSTLPAISYISHDYPTTIVNVNLRSGERQARNRAARFRCTPLLDTRYIQAE